MGKREVIFVLVIYNLIHLLGCGKSENELKENELQTQIENESFTNDTQVGRAIKDVVDVEVNAVSGEHISLLIKAPNISEELFLWLDQIGNEQFDEQKFEEEIIQLLYKCEKSDFYLELYYDGIVSYDVYYTDEYINIITCGLNEFYSLMMQKTIEYLRSK